VTERTAVAQARTDLHDALKTVTPSTWRVHRTAPPQVTAPVVFIDSPSIVTQGSGIVGVVFPVVMVVDGTVRAQLEQLDDLLSAVWSAASRVGMPTGSNPTALDVGGPSLRAQVLSIEITMAAITLCAPSLVTAGSA
jgi:hypothetical protein